MTSPRPTSPAKKRGENRFRPHVRLGISRSHTLERKHRYLFMDLWRIEKRNSGFPPPKRDSRQKEIQESPKGLPFTPKSHLKGLCPFIEFSPTSNHAFHTRITSLSLTNRMFGCSHFLTCSSSPHTPVA